MKLAVLVFAVAIVASVHGFKEAVFIPSHGGWMAGVGASSYRSTDGKWYTKCNTVNIDQDAWAAVKDEQYDSVDGCKSYRIFQTSGVDTEQRLTMGGMASMPHFVIYDKETEYRTVKTLPFPGDFITYRNSLSHDGQWFTECENEYPDYDDTRVIRTDYKRICTLWRVVGPTDDGDYELLKYRTRVDDGPIIAAGTHL